VPVFCRWNQLDVAIVLLSVVGIVLEEMKSGIIPINPTIIRVMRVLRIARGNGTSCIAVVQIYNKKLSYR